MLDKLKSMLRSDDLLPTLTVFPEIDQEKIRKELRLDEEGQQRGTKQQPAPGTTSFDAVEARIINRINDVRNKGLENYENNRQVYNERLSRAGTMRKEVEIVAQNASGDYLTAVRGWKAQMTPVTERLFETFQHRKGFREQHGLSRPAKHFEGWGRFAAIVIIFIGVETALNAFMFSRGNEQGLAGGGMTAFVFSLVNVVMSLLLGIWACNLNHSKLLRKLAGLCSLAAWILLALAVNLTVAHFRDLIDAQVIWSDAIQEAVPALRANPFGLTSMDSWFLFALGSLISIFAFIKGWYAFDPFPGYSKVERDLANARADHAGHFEDAISELTDKRDQAIDELRDADQQVRDGISQAIDALYGHSTLNAHLEGFLDQCDTKVAYLLAVYRDANITARTEPAPPSFSTGHTFPGFRTAITADEGRKKTAEEEAQKITQAVESAIRQIFESFKSAVVEFQLPEEVQRGVSPSGPSVPSMRAGAGEPV
ncbi:BAR domain-containing protein [Paracoccus rhizosphaerae]|uniref:Uncharacterized protein n=1 Tax=Paracoccus rhizosphaerae TaxID=1133347 RepID=A0ABV6CHV9_9RHOB|nr:hypothetical protein [Paracoccus rhizosphaerae]